MRVAIIHPGEMGSSIGAAIATNGHEVRWASAGRSNQTRARAEADGHVDADSLAGLVEGSEIVISVCPPGAATAVADQVANLRFGGLYLDANAVAPSTARQIATTTTAAGATFVDGGIVGPPARHRGLTVLYISGDEAPCRQVVDLCAGSPLETHLVDGPAGAASAVKMAFAAWTKGTSALLLAIGALAEAEGVADGLEHAWSVLTPDLVERLPAAARATAPKAWRFVAEMEEIAATFHDAGLPRGFHQGAAQIYAQLADLRNQPDPTRETALEEVLARLTSRSGGTRSGISRPGTARTKRER